MITGLKRPLYEYQEEDVNFFFNCGGRGINASEMGSGKTAVTIAFFVKSGFKRCLVVVPASLKFTWEAEVKKWSHLRSVVIDSKTKINEIDTETEIWIINYDILSKFAQRLQSIHFDCIVADEATAIKSLNAKRTIAFRYLSRRMKSVLLLSGTPLLSRPSELFSLLNIVDPQRWTNFWQFARNYCALKSTRWGMDYSGASNVEDLHNRIKGYFIRRKKEDILKDLPPMIFQDIPIQLSKEKRKEYEEAEKNFAKYLKDHVGKQANEVAKIMQAEKLAKLNSLRQISAAGKVGQVIEFSENILETGEKVLIFGSFVSPLKEIKQHFGDRAVIITGETPVQERQKAVELFQEDPIVQVFIGGYKSSGTGLTLTAAANFIGLDFPWCPADLSQAYSRMHRPGQKAASVNIYQFVAMGTIDVDMRDTLMEKQIIFDKVIDGQLSNAAAKSAMDKIIARIKTQHENDSSRKR